MKQVVVTKLILGLFLSMCITQSLSAANKEGLIPTGGLTPRQLAILAENEELRQRLAAEKKRQEAIDEAAARSPKVSPGGRRNALSLSPETEDNSANTRPLARHGTPPPDGQTVTHMPYPPQQKAVALDNGDSARQRPVCRGGLGHRQRTTTQADDGDDSIGSSIESASAFTAFDESKFVDVTLLDCQAAEPLRRVHTALPPKKATEVEADDAPSTHVVLRGYKSVLNNFYKQLPKNELRDSLKSLTKKLRSLLDQNDCAALETLLPTFNEELAAVSTTIDLIGETDEFDSADLIAQIDTVNVAIATGTGT